jgi:hypothetical protein
LGGKLTLRLAASFFTTAFFFFAVPFIIGSRWSSTWEAQHFGQRCLVVLPVIAFFGGRASSQVITISQSTQLGSSSSVEQFSSNSSSNASNASSTRGLAGCCGGAASFGDGVMGWLIASFGDGAMGWMIAGFGDGTMGWLIASFGDGVMGWLIAGRCGGAKNKAPVPP